MVTLLPAFEFTYVDQDDCHLPFINTGGHRNPKTPRLKKQQLVIRAVSMQAAEAQFVELYPRYHKTDVREVSSVADLSVLSSLIAPRREKAKKLKTVDPRSVQGFKSYLDNQSSRSDGSHS